MYSRWLSYYGSKIEPRHIMLVTWFIGSQIICMALYPVVNQKIRSDVKDLNLPLKIIVLCFWLIIYIMLASAVSPLVIIVGTLIICAKLIKRIKILLEPLQRKWRTRNNARSHVLQQELVTDHQVVSISRILSRLAANELSYNIQLTHSDPIKPRNEDILPVIYVQSTSNPTFILTTDSMCSICLTLVCYSGAKNEAPDFDAASTNDACVTSCDHVMHYGCISEWLVINPTCPTCRRGLTIAMCVLLRKTSPTDVDAPKAFDIDINSDSMICNSENNVRIISNTVDSLILNPSALETRPLFTLRHNFRQGSRISRGAFVSSVRE